jgi:hypothetical protein
MILTPLCSAERLRVKNIDIIKADKILTTSFLIETPMVEVRINLLIDEGSIRKECLWVNL